MKSKTVLTLVLMLIHTAALSQPSAALHAIPNLNVQRYLGRWYEIAKFPNRFQKQCVSDTSAQYTLLPDGNLRVLNQCRLANGELKQAVGLAKQTGGPESAKLQVRFAPVWLSFLPFVWGNYWIIDLDDRYELAAVSEPKREYLWILSRTPVIEDAKYSALLSRLAALGLDISKLEKTPQKSP